MDTIGARIAYLRNTMQLSQELFAAAISAQVRAMTADGVAAPVSRGAVANWEAEKGIKSQNQIAISELTGASLDWLMFGRGQPPDIEHLEVLGRRLRPLSLPQTLQLGAATVFCDSVPIYGRAAGALLASSGSFVFGETEAVGYAPMMPGLAGERDVYALVVEETSMLPMFPPGTPVYVSPHRTPHRDDAVIVTEMRSSNGRQQTFIKLYQRETPQQIITRQLNPDAEIAFDKRHEIICHRVYPLRELVGV